MGGELHDVDGCMPLADDTSRKNFDRHFQESRHAFGMRALGLPNTKHFHEITRIEDALSRESLLHLLSFLI